MSGERTRAEAGGSLPASAADAAAVSARFERYHQTRDRALRDDLIVEHLGLARALARRYSGRGESV
ncbi:MAG: hypothetical protein ABJC79_13530, partial [Acidimicrobiia bacterium]